MTYYHKVLLYLFNGLTKVFAINEFSFARDKHKFVRSQFWHYYVKIWHWFYIYPMFGVGIMMFDMERPNQLLDYNRITLRMVECMLSIRFIAIAVIGWLILRQRCCLQGLLNRFLRLERMHRQIFGLAVHVPASGLASHLLRELLQSTLASCMISWRTWYFMFHFLRTIILFYCTDVAMLLHMHLIQSLTLHLDQSMKLNSTKRSQCLKYFENLLSLRQNMQQLWFLSNTTRLIIELLIITQFGMGSYWLEDEKSLLCTLTICLISSNMLRIMKMAKYIYEMERKILDRLYMNELFRLMRRPKTTRSWRLEKLEQLHLKRCTLKECSVSIFNYMYLRNTLIGEICDFIFTNILLIIGFSVKYTPLEDVDDIRESLNGPHTIQPFKL